MLVSCAWRRRLLDGQRRIGEVAVAAAATLSTWEAEAVICVTTLVVRLFWHYFFVSEKLAGAGKSCYPRCHSIGAGSLRLWVMSPSVCREAMYVLTYLCSAACSLSKETVIICHGLLEKWKKHSISLFVFSYVMTETLSFLYKRPNWMMYLNTKFMKRTAISLIKFRVWSTQNLYFVKKSPCLSSSKTNFSKDKNIFGP